jgi:hypothetical protein
VDYRQLRFKIYRMPLKYETDLFPFGERFNWLSTVSADFFIKNKDYVR